MAFAKINQVTEEERKEIKRYVGMMKAEVVCLNPTDREWEGIFGRPPKNPVSYTDVFEVDGKRIPEAKFTFVLRSKTEGGEGELFLMTYRIRKRERRSLSGKIEIIDKYGRNAWATEEDFKAHRVPVYASGRPAGIDQGYRAALDGEEDLVDFLRNFFGIPNVEKNVDGEWVMIDDPASALCGFSLEEMASFLSGNFTSLKEMVASCTNLVKVMVGVRRSDDGNLYQTIYTRKTLPANYYKYDIIWNDYEKAAERGSFRNVIFSGDLLHEYVEKPTPVDDLPVGDMPSDDMPLPGEQGGDPFNFFNS